MGGGPCRRLLLKSLADVTGLRKYKVAIFIPVFNREGTCREAFLLARELRHQWSIDAEVWACWDGNALKEFESAGIPVKVLYFSQPHCPVRVVRFSYWIVRLARVAHQIRSGRVDVLLPFGSMPNIIAGLTYWLGGVRLCMWGERAKGEARGERLIARCYRHFVANSSAALDRLQNHLGVTRERISLIPNGAEEQVGSDGNDWRTKLGMAADQLLVVKVANIANYRDHKTLLLAWKIVQDGWDNGSAPVLALAGSFGDAYQECRRTIRRLGLEPTVRFLGPIADTKALIDAADLTVFSTVSPDLPNAVLEYMASGKAVVANDAPGTRDALGKTADRVLVPSGDSAHLAQVVNELLRDGNARQALGAANRERAAAAFSVARMARQYVEAIRVNLIRERPATADTGLPESDLVSPKTGATSSHPI